MKKFVLTIMLIGLISGSAFANYTGVLGQRLTSSDMSIVKTTILATNTAYPVTFSAGAVASWTLFASGGDINLTLTNSTTANKITIPQGGSIWDHFPVPLAKDTTLYVWSSTAPVTLEGMYSYY